MFSSRETILVKLNGLHDLSYQPGDHAAIFAKNDKILVNTVLERVAGCSDPDQILRLEAKDEFGGKLFCYIKYISLCRIILDKNLI